jgi:hypothetical protein
MVSGLVMGLVPASASAVGGDDPQEYTSTPDATGDGSCVLILNPGTPNSVILAGDPFTIRCVFFGYEGPTTATPMNFRLNSFGTASGSSIVLTASSSGSRYPTLARGSGAGVWGGECVSCFEWSGTIAQAPSSAIQWGVPGIVDNGYTDTSAYFVEHGWIAAAGSGHFAVSTSATAIPPRNGSGGVVMFASSAPPDECSGLTVEIEGDTEPFVAGDDLIVNVVNPASNPVGSLEIKLSTDRAWFGVFAGQIGENGTYTVPVTPGSTVDTSLIRFKCVRANGSIGYISYGSGVVSDDDAYLRGCKAITVSWPTAASVENVTHGDTFDVVVDYQGPWGDALEDVVLQSRFLVDSGDDGPGDGAYYWVTQDIGTVVSGTRSTLTVVVPSSANLPQAVNLDKRFFLGCNEASESNLPLIGWGTLAPGFSSTDGQYFDVPVEASCFSDLDVGYNPKTWVPGLVRTWSCTMKALFVPDSDSVTSELNSFKDKLRSNAPYSWGIASYSALLGFFTGSLEGLENAQLCTQYFAETTMEPTTFEAAQPIELPALSFCVPEQFLTGHWVQFRTFAGLAVWVSLALTCVRILTHTPAPADPEQLTLF